MSNEAVVLSALLEHNSNLEMTVHSYKHASEALADWRDGNCNQEAVTAKFDAHGQAHPSPLWSTLSFDL